jgi:hypothetical protein
MMEDRFDDLLREAAQEYHRPPETPRDFMWARIEAVRRERARRREQLRILYSPWTRWGLGLAAALVIGIGIGRWTLREHPGGESMVIGPEVSGLAEDPAGRAARGQLAFRLAATAHLSRAEAFLTSFRADPRAGESDAEFWSGAGELLSSTRLLLDSPAAEDPVFRALLEELELVLVQIVRLPYERGGDEVDLVTEGLERRGLLLRLRTAIPAGPAAGVEGVS